MAVDFSFAIGYGIVIEREDFEAVENIIEDINDCDEWADRWAKCINCWTGDEYFVGITYNILDYDDSVVRFDKDKSLLNPKDTAEFLKFYNKYHLEKFFEWKPDCCAIAFVW